MRLHHTYTNCEGIHRSGWPAVIESLKQHVTTDGILVDDFVEQTFVYKRTGYVHEEPWVGFFHHPVFINSPIARDQKNALSKTVDKASESLPNLKAAVCLCDTAREYLERVLDVPVLCIKHPTGKPSMLWHFTPRAWQVGYFLRDLRFLQRCELPKGWYAARTAPYEHFQMKRDRALENRGFKRHNVVTNESRVPNEQYDQLLAASVVHSHLFGAAANNVTVECIARNTPLVVNRSLETAWYLGEEYPLFYDGDVPPVITESAALEASQYLQAMNKDFLDIDEFTLNLADFIEGVSNE